LRPGLKKIIPIQLDLSVPVSIMGATKEASNIEVVINNAGILIVSNLLKDLAISNLEHEIEC
jgi:short-subunit dehydrogenase involved in D-alanine esterification of teichoic acids